MASVFTRIIQGEIPCYKVAEDEHHIAFLDINPVAKGHTLIVPKQEIDYVFDLSDERLSSTLLFAKKVAKAIDKAFSTVRTGIIVEGLEVPHAHIHLIPIHYHGQAVSLRSKTNIAASEMPDIAAAIANAMEA